MLLLTQPDRMQLPPLDTQPVIMAGLGTGAAPFRAFIQERAWQREQGREIGPLLYYFGSRHRSEEYLYGEELEAYVQDGVLTHTGLAFSRDTDKKVYIQHKMNEDAELLAKMLENGAFYLCGPTWPVPGASLLLRACTLSVCSRHSPQMFTRRSRRHSWVKARPRSRLRRTSKSSRLTSATFSKSTRDLSCYSCGRFLDLHSRLVRAKSSRKHMPRFRLSTLALHNSRRNSK